MRDCMNIFLHKRTYAFVIISLLLTLPRQSTAQEQQSEENSQQQSNAEESAEGMDTSNTTVRADEMDFDFKEGKIVMEGNVIVKDKKMTIRSNDMTVFLTPENKMKKVVADGNVRIVNPAENRKANSGHAVYEVKKGTVVLTENPRVEMADHTLENAKKIIFHRDSERVETVGSGTKLQFSNTNGQGLNFEQNDDTTDTDSNDTE